MITNMKVLIVGTGIAGLSSAIFLQKKGIEIKIIDRVSKPTHFGYTIILYPNSTFLLKNLGVYEEVRAQSKLITESKFLDEQGRFIFKIDFSEFIKKGESEMLTMDRETLHHSLVKRLGEEKIFWQTEITDINEKEDYVEATFKDGSKEKFDFIIGADGVYSSIRMHYFADDEMKSYHSLTYMFWLDTKKWKIPKTVVSYSGPHSSLMLLPTNKNCTVYVISVADVSQEFIDIDLFEKEFSNYNNFVFEIVKSMKSAKNVYKTPVRHVETKEVYRGRVVLIGDAIHTTNPSNGMGSTIAMQDSYVLAEELSKPYSNYRDALKAFQKRREKVFDVAKKVSDSASDLAIKSKSNPLLKYSYIFAPLILESPAVTAVVCTLTSISLSFGVGLVTSSM